MKKIVVFISFLLVFISCEKPSDCIEGSGDLVSKIIPVNPFSRIKVYRGVAVTIIQGNEYKVEIRSGSNSIDGISVNQIGNQLILADNSSCNWFREYGQTTVYITTPTLEEIYSKTEQDINSSGVLTYPVLKLFSIDKTGDGENSAGTGDFHLNINNNLIQIESNNVSRFYISGTTNTEIINFWSGDSRIEASNLIAQNVSVFHRSSNDMVVHPIQSITGKMVSTGNVILKNNPPIVDVQQLYQGHLIYN